MCTNAGESPDRRERRRAVMSPFQLVLTLAVLALPFTVDVATAQPRPGVSDPMPAPVGPASPSPLQPGDAFGEQVTLPERTMVYLKGHSKWDTAFDTLIDACADCDLNIRIARDWPAYCHGELILEYRKHGGNMSKNPALMLRTALAANRLQFNYVKGNRRLEEAAKEGKRVAREYFGPRVLARVHYHVGSHEWKSAMSGTWTLLRYDPVGLARHTWRKLFRVLGIQN